MRMKIEPGLTAGASPNGKAAAFGAAICRFESYRPSQALPEAGGIEPDILRVG